MQVIAEERWGCGAYIGGAGMSASGSDNQGSWIEDAERNGSTLE
jgi:hypothetical protein